MGLEAMQLLLGELYEAILDPGAWVRFMDGLSRMINADGGQFLLWEVDRDRGAFSAISASFPAGAGDEYAAHYGSLDPLRNVALALPHDRWVLCHEHLDAGTISRSEFYADFLTRNGVRYRAGMRARSSAGLVPLMGLLRAPERGEYRGKERDVLTGLLPHIQRAAGLFVRARQLQLRASATASVLDQLDYPIFVTDAQARIHFTSGAGDALLRVSDVLGAAGGRLTSSVPRVAQDLLRLISRATRTSGAAGGALGVRRDATQDVQQVLVLPLSPESALRIDLCAGPLALVVVVSPEGGAALPEQRLIELFALTPMEAKVAHALAEGRSIEELAEWLAITLNTARTHLHHVFAKVGVRRQAQLVKLLSLAPRVRDRGP